MREDSGRPRIEITGTIAAHARELGVTHLHLALTHDGGFACAVVVAEGGSDVGAPSTRRPPEEGP